MNLPKHFQTCANCNKPVFPTTMIIMDAVLDQAVQEYIYCSNRCLDEKLSKINSTNGKFDIPIEIDYREKLSNNPERWRIVFRIKDLKVKAI
jgi:hypothetical protein